MSVPFAIKKSRESFMSGMGIPGAWWVWKMPGGIVVYICCPKCRNLIDLTKYTIAQDGTVKPDVECRASYCQWTEVVKLEDWEG
jgi:hypothetical protein